MQTCISNVTIPHLNSCYFIHFIVIWQITWTKIAVLNNDRCFLQRSSWESLIKKVLYDRRCLMYWWFMSHALAYLSIKLMCDNHTPQGPCYQHDPMTQIQTGHTFTYTYLLIEVYSTIHVWHIYIKISATVIVSTCQLCTYTTSVESSVIPAQHYPLSQMYMTNCL